MKNVTTANCNYGKSFGIGMRQKLYAAHKGK